MAHNHSSGSSNAMAQRKKQEEKNSQVLRELLSLPGNKHCFECGQRGPTYADVTIGSFCCMHCSGLLRGLNPPHRLKSISMATFSDEDLEKMKKTGNEENAKIWLGLYESRKGMKLEKKSEDDVRQYLIQKYEQRRWYVSPDDLTEQKRLLDEYSNSKRNELNASPSILSHQSNQSAPANLHSNPTGSNEKPSVLDLLTGDLFPPSSQQSGTTNYYGGSLSSIPTSNTIAPAAPLQAPTDTPLKDPLSYSGVPPALRFPYSKIPHSSTVAFASFSEAQSNHQFQPASCQTVDFTNFETQFDSTLHIGKQGPAKISQVSPSKPNLTQSASAFTLGQRPTPPPLPQSQPVVWPGQELSSRSGAKILNSQHSIDSADLFTSTMKPIREGPSGNEVDYSALEELYRAPSAQKAHTNGSESETGQLTTGQQTLCFDPFRTFPAANTVNKFVSNQSPPTLAIDGGAIPAGRTEFSDFGFATNMSSNHSYGQGQTSNPNWNPFA